MTYEMEEEMSSVCNMGEAIRRKAEAEGRIEGRIEGRVEGESRLGALMAKLFSLNRMDDARRCTTDVEFREKLYKEFQLA